MPLCRPVEPVSSQGRRNWIVDSLDRLSGLIAATCTSMYQDGSLDLKQVTPIVEYLISRETSGMYVCGRTIPNHRRAVPDRGGIH
ncbi:MAG: dihydrodipicolinate synthase family protein [Limnochordia bacterium]